MTETIYWYDFETTGTDSILDRAIQFAGVRTDFDLNIIGSPMTLYCQPGEDVVPSPEAVSVTGIMMSELGRQGLSEAAFCARILEQFSIPETCVAGYNSIRFDDEFTRQMLYRNFFEPYAREWRSGNSRWDVIDLFRMAYALRPEGMEWPHNEMGVPSFRLEILTHANGIGHEDAHDAVSDVLATIELTRLLKEKQERLFAYLFNLRSKKQVLRQLYPLGKSALVHVSSMYPAKQGCLCVVVPLCNHPTNTNGIICYDLSVSPDVLIAATSEEVHHLVFSATTELDKTETRLPLKTIHINRCPAIAPMATLNDGIAVRLGVDKEVCQRHLKQLQQASGIVEKIVDAFEIHHFAELTDPDFMLYQGDFFGRNDLEVMADLRQARPERLAEFAGRFQDSRLDEMLFRYRARNYPRLLDETDSARWKRFKLSRWKGGSVVDDAIEKTSAYIEDKGELPYLIDLRKYLQKIRDSV